MREWVAGGPDFVRMCTAFRSSAFRWECQGSYHEPHEDSPFRRWQNGDTDTSFMDGWVKTIREIRDTGRTFTRVRMVTEPPTEYLEWMFTVTAVNVSAGEDIRWISESGARGLEMPEYDFYLLDDQRVAILRFGDSGVAGAEVTDDAAEVAAHRVFRDVAWAAAVPHERSKYAMTRSP